MNFIVISSAGIKSVDCRYFVLIFLQEKYAPFLFLWRYEKIINVLLKQQQQKKKKKKKTEQQKIKKNKNTLSGVMAKSTNNYTTLDTTTDIVIMKI